MGDDLGEGEPIGDLDPFAKAPPQFGAGDVQHRGPFGQFVDGIILCFFLHIDHLFEIDHFDTDFGLMGPHQILRGVGVVEILACRVLARTGVIATHDEMREPVVFADDRVPERLARAGHAHGEVQER